MDVSSEIIKLESLKSKLRKYRIKPQTLVDKHNQIIFTLRNHILSSHLKYHSPLQTIVYENRTLLANRNFNLKVTSTGGSPLTDRTKRFHGSIHANGNIYFSATANSIFNSFSSIFYPLEYKGRINDTGDCTMELTKTRFSFFGRVPDYYDGHIDEKLNLTIRTSKSWSEIGGQAFVTKIVGDPFQGNKEIKKQYARNLQEIKKIVDEEFRKLTAVTLDSKGNKP